MALFRTVVDLLDYSRKDTRVSHTMISILSIVQVMACVACSRTAWVSVNVTQFADHL